MIALAWIIPAVALPAIAALICVGLGRVIEARERHEGGE